MKKKLVIILPISIIIITATVLCILYFCTNIFKSGEQLFWGYIIKNSGILNTLENENEINNKIEELDMQIEEALKKENKLFSTDTKLLETQLEEKLKFVKNLTSKLL